MSEQTAPTVFSFESSVKIRMVMIDQRPYFVAQDVCAALDIKAVDVALRKLDSDEKGTYSIRTPGGYQSQSVISEPGLYTMMLRCRKAVEPGTSAFRFRKWVTSEVLPQIRKTGKYSHPGAETLADLVGSKELAAADKASQVVQSFMPAILEAMKQQEQKYSYPAKPGYRDFIHSPEGVASLADRSYLMNLLRELEENGNDVGGAVMELTTMVNYIAGVSKCLNDIRSHAQYITKNATGF